jgi:hypothetical protein
MLPPCDVEQPRPVLAPDTGRVDDGEAPRLQAQVEDRGDQVERLGRRPLVVLVVATRPRQTSEDTISVGLKWRLAKVDLPEPDAPISSTSENSGTVILIA